MPEIICTKVYQFPELSDATKDKARINALYLAINEVSHLFDKPIGREHLPVVGNALFGLDKAHAEITRARRRRGFA